MSDQILTREELSETIQSLLLKYHAESAILFGSYARQEADGVSDIDVVIIGGASFEPTDVFSLADDLQVRFRNQIGKSEDQKSSPRTSSRACWR